MKSIYPGTTQFLLTININTWLQSCELSTPLPLGAILLAIGVVMNISYKSSSKCHTGTQLQLSNQLLIKLYKSHRGTQAQLSNKLLIDLYQIPRYDISRYVSTRTQLLYTVIKPEFLQKLMYLRFLCYKLKLIDELQCLRCYLSHVIKTIMLHIYSQLKLNSCNFKIIKDRYNIVKLSPHMFTVQFKINVCIQRINMDRYKHS